MFTIDFGYPLGKYEILRIPAACGDEEHVGHIACSPGWEEELRGGDIVLRVLYDGTLWVAYVLRPVGPRREAHAYLPVEEPERVRLGLLHPAKECPDYKKPWAEKLRVLLCDDGIFLSLETVAELYEQFSEDFFHAHWCVSEVAAREFVQHIKEKLGR